VSCLSHGTGSFTDDLRVRRDGLSRGTCGGRTAGHDGDRLVTMRAVAQGLGDALGRAFGRAFVAGAKAAARSLLRSPGRRPPTVPAPHPQEPRTSSAPDPAIGDGYPGDFTGRVTIEYRPDPDGDPDPGEVVWGWVPFEEDHGRGKDRPVLLIGRDGGWLLGLMLSSQDHDRDAAQEARHGRVWTDVGSGDWDRSGRPSEVRLDRVVRLDPGAVRREGGVLRRAVFEDVAAQVRRVNGWDS
jgi:PemK-like, MazF-like toxin of type II toxin-antitoxin system